MAPTYILRVFVQTLSKLIKTCPQCSTENQADEVVCTKCQYPLDTVDPLPLTQSNVQPISTVSRSLEIAQNESVMVQKPQASMTVLEGLHLACPDGTVIPCRHQEIIGREGTIMTEFFKEFKTISRKHARIISKAGTWYIIDLNSCNGTFINDYRLTPNKEHPLRLNDCLRFSSKLEVIVKSI